MSFEMFLMDIQMPVNKVVVMFGLSGKWKGTVSKIVVRMEGSKGHGTCCA